MRNRLMCFRPKNLKKLLITKPYLTRRCDRLGKVFKNLIVCFCMCFGFIITKECPPGVWYPRGGHKAPAPYDAKGRTWVAKRACVKAPRTQGHKVAVYEGPQTAVT